MRCRCRSSPKTVVVTRPTRPMTTAVRSAWATGSNRLCHLRRSSSNGSRASPDAARPTARARRRDGPRAARAAAGARRVPHLRRRHRVRRACATRWRRPRPNGVAVHGWCADLTQHPLPAARFDLVRRHALPAARSVSRAARGVRARRRRAVRDLHDRAARARHRADVARSPAEPGELRERFDGFEVLFYEEVTAPEAVARIAARRPRLAAPA